MAAEIRVGECRELLRAMPDESVQCVVTSPPYWGLRSYTGGDGMIGLEPTFDEHLANLGRGVPRGVAGAAKRTARAG